jgi:uncharacterized membrane protein
VLESFGLFKMLLLGLLAILFIYAGVMHFLNPKPFLNIMPEWLPNHLELVYVSGVFEILGGVGLLLPWTRKYAAWGLIMLLFAVFPANIHMAIRDKELIDGQGSLGWKSWARLPVQFFLIKWARLFTH